MTSSVTDQLLVETPNGVERGVQTDDEKRQDSKAPWLMAELEMQFWLAGPMVCVNLMQFALHLVSVMFVGHLGEMALASASIATSFAGVTGFSLLMGMACALETLCGQAYGAKQYHLLGVYLQRAIVVLTATCIPISLVWLCVSPLLRAVGQDPEISEYAGEYARWMIPTIFAYAFLQPLVKFLQMQSAVLPMALCSGFTLVIHIPVCWLLIYKLGVGFRGAAIASGISEWCNVLLLVIYAKFGAAGKKTWGGFSVEAFHDMKGFFALALPSAVMLCLENWSFELMIFLSGLLPNPQLEMSSLAISLNTLALMYMIPFGLSASVSTRVSNELGAGRASAAKKALLVGVTVGLGEGLLMSMLCYSLRNVWGYAFTGELEVVEYVAKMIPLLAILAIVDSLQAVLCGVARGCGMQELGAYTNLGAYFVVGVPLAVVLAFRYHFNGKGLWTGILAALFVQSTVLFIIVLRTDWEKQADDAVNRVKADYLSIAESESTNEKENKNSSQH